MTEQVEELTRGEALARVAVLEAEAAELRKRVCVPGAAAALEALVTACWDFSSESVECKYDGFYSEVVASREWDKFRAAVEAADGVLATTLAPVERVEQESAELDSRLRAAGMTGVAELLKGAPLDAFIKHAGVNDLGSLLQWAEMRRAECLRAMARYDLGEKPEGDDLYEWTVAHCAAFTELHINLRAAITTPQPAPTAAQDVVGLVEALQLFVRWVDMEQSENVTAGVFDRLKAFRNAETKARAVLAAHQSGGAK